MLDSSNTLENYFSDHMCQYKIGSYGQKNNTATSIQECLPLTEKWLRERFLP